MTMNNLQFGDIVLMKFPFTDFSSFKNRPAVCLKQINEDVVVCFLSSKLSSKSKHDIVLKKDKLNFLKVDSIIKTWKIFTVHEQLMYKKLGGLKKTDKRRLRTKLMRLMSELK
jgi:mRNA interferase MazF